MLHFQILEAETTTVLAKQVNNSGFTPFNNYFSKMGELISQGKNSDRIANLI